MTNASKLTKASLFSALGFICIYLSTLIINNKLFFLGLASLIIPLCLLLTDVKHGFLTYIVTSLISFFLLGINISVLSYIVFFGIYGIIKYYCEKSKNLITEYILKFLFFNGCLLILHFIFKDLLFKELTIKLPNFIFLLILQLLFLFYDYILTIFITYFKRKIVKSISHNP